MLTRREFLATSSAALLAQPRRRPNVLVFMTDQESGRRGDLAGPADTPNRRRIDQIGTRFTSAFCNTPQCSAARSSLLTGLEPHQTGVITNVDGGSLGKPLSPSLPTVGSVFRSAGYSTGYFGKWHLGNAGTGLGEFGFDTHQGERGGDDEAARQAAEWIGRQKAPWLAWVSVVNPHDIYSVGREWERIRLRPGVKPPVTDVRNLEGKPSEQREYVDKDQGKAAASFTPQDWIRYRSYYLDLLEKADANLGTVLGAIPDLNSTIIVYTSDHGDALGEHGLAFKGPFMYEENIRIPLVIAAPGAFGRGERDDLVTQADLAPTLTALGGLQWPRAVTGRDLSRKAPERDAVFLEYYAKQKWINPIRTIRTRKWKLNWYDRGNKELYDLANDPHETRNLAGNPSIATVQKELEKRLEAWRPPMLKP